MNNNYVAWCRHIGAGSTLRVVTCDSDDMGAFPVYKEKEILRLTTCIEKILNMTVTTPIDQLRNDVMEICKTHLKGN